MIPDTVPEILRAGETTKFRRSLSEYSSANGWGYAIYLNGATKTLSKSGVAQDDGSFLVTFSPADALPAGTYKFVERVSKDGEVYGVGDGYIVVELDLATAPAGATLSHAERTLQVIEAAIEGRLPADLQSYTIAGRAVVKIPIETLTRLRGTYRSLVYREQHPGELGGGTVEIVFGSEGGQ